MDFDILGKYFNDVKPGECLKDYYLRVLFEIGYDPILNVYSTEGGQIDYRKTSTKNLSTYFNKEFELTKELSIFIVGGATKEMMMDDSISYTGNMRSNTFNSGNNGIFRKLKIKNALDAVSILKIILSVTQEEHMRGK